MLIFLVVTVLVLGQAAFADNFIAGTNTQGSNINQPRPQKSRFLRTYAAGFAVSPAEAKYALYADIDPSLGRRIFVRAEFQNPLAPGSPLSEEGEITVGQASLEVVSQPVRGLRRKHTYWVKVYLYETFDRQNPIDILTQNILSNVDSTGDRIVFKAVPAPQR